MLCPPNYHFFIYFISDDGSGYPKWNSLQKQPANVENSIMPRQYTDSNMFPEHGGRQFVSPINRCDPTKSKKIVTSYLDVAKKLVPTSRNLIGGDKLDFKSGSNEPQTEAKDKDFTTENVNSTNDKDKNNTSSMGDMEKLCEERHDQFISDIDVNKTKSTTTNDSGTIVSSTLISLTMNKHEDDKVETRILKGGSCSYENDHSRFSGSNLIAFPYMQVRFCSFHA